MPVRKTESRIPANFQPGDLGEATISVDGRVALIAYCPSPIVLLRTNVYVVMLMNDPLALAVNGYEWVISENGTERHRSITPIGELEYTPQAAGSVSITVTLQGGGNPILHLAQSVVVTNPQLETLITAAGNTVGPTIADPAIARELVNHYCQFYSGVTTTPPEAGQAAQDFQRLIFKIVYEGTAAINPTTRKQKLAQLADILNSSTPNFSEKAWESLGLCGLRAALLAMFYPDANRYQELPIDITTRSQRRLQITTQIDALNINQKVDLFNLLRFPKSNIIQSAKIIEALRNRKFAGTNFTDVLTGFQGARLNDIINHFRQGPNARV
jgi:hypothetical protein